MSTIDIVYAIEVTILIIFSLKSRKKFGFIINHYTLTNLFWCGVLMLSIYYNTYDRPISNEVYYIFFIGLISFNLSMFTSKIKRIPDQIVSKDFSLKKRRILEIMTLLAVVPLAYKNLKLLLSGVDLWIINHEYWDEGRQGNYFEMFYSQNVIQPLSSVLMATCFFAKYRDSSYYSKWISIILAVSFALLNMLLTGGGRTGLITLVYIMLLSMIAGRIIKDSSIVYSINLKWIAGFIILGFIGIAWSSAGRGDSSSLMEVLSFRLALSPAVFEGYYYDEAFWRSHTWGLSMFETPFVILTMPLRLLGICFDFERLSTLEQLPHWTPADGLEHNAVVTAYLYYLKDFGLAGVVIGPFLVGKIYNIIWNYFRKEPFLLFFYFSGICVTCLDTYYPFARGFTFVLIFVLLYNKYVKEKI